MALTQYYVNPALAGNVGAGSIGDPWGDVQWALNQIVRDAVKGDQVNIKAGVAEILVAPLTLAAYGGPTSVAPLILRGYTATKNDGGVGEIDANGFTLWFSANYNAIVCIDMNLHNGPAMADFIDLDEYCGLIRCEVHDCWRGVDWNHYFLIAGCKFHDCVMAIDVNINGLVWGNDIETNDPAFNFNAIVTKSPIIHNVIKIAGHVGDAITMTYGGPSVVNNAIYMPPGALPGRAIYITGELCCFVANNLIEGFNTAAIVLSAGKAVIHGNRWYNCGAGITGQTVFDRGDNSELTESPFMDAAADDFRPQRWVADIGWPRESPLFGIVTNLDMGGIGHAAKGVSISPVGGVG